MTTLLAALAGTLLALTAAALVAAAPPDGAGHQASGPQGPPAANVHAHTDGHGHDHDRDSGVTGGPLVPPPANRQPPGQAAGTTPPSLSSGAAAATSVTVPITGAAVPTVPTQVARRNGPALSALPGVTLVPPASLPSPATFVPAAPAHGDLPVFAIAAAVALCGGLVGLRILRRPG